MYRRLLPLLLIVLFVGFALQPSQDTGLTPGNAELNAPSFVGVTAQAQTSSEEATFLEEEAGIAAYYKTDQSIDIDRLRDSFNVVEQDSADYITGQIPVQNLEENWHPKVFVNTDGWVVAYYPQREPTSMMLALWVRRDDTTLTGTTLELAIRETLRSAGLSSLPGTQEISYYHFQHPNADTVMLIREDGGHGDQFNLTVPSGLVISDATWASNSGTGNFDFRIDDRRLEGAAGVHFGDLVPHLSTDVTHNLGVHRGTVGLILLYKAPEGNSGER